MRISRLNSTSTSEPSIIGTEPNGHPSPSLKRLVTIHPLLFASFPMLALFARNSGEVPIAQLYRPLGLSILATGATWLLFSAILRNYLKAAVVASSSILAFFTYGHLVNLAPNVSQDLIAFGILCTLAILLIVIVRSKSSLSEMTKILNFVSIVLVAPSVWSISVHLATSARSTPSTRVVAPAKRNSPAIVSSRKVSAVKANDQPDIYYIILDAYARADSLKKFYNFDNSAFIQQLKDRGFYVASKSRANYNQTPLCLASSLNMTYLNGLPGLTDQEGAEPCRRMLDDNAVVNELAKFGYQYLYIWSGAGQTRVETADRILNDRSGLSNFETNALALSAAASHTQDQRYVEHRDWILGAFNEMSTVAKLPSPKFVFTHIISPHPPFVFGPHGEAIDPKGDMSFSDGSWLLKMISREQYIQGYISQLQFINQKTIHAIDSILKQSRKRPVIILQADHGSRMNLDWDSEERTDMREPFSILNAYCVPDKVRTHLYDTISPVNTFRILLNQMFGAHYKVLPDMSYYSGADHPYDFKDETRKIETAKGPAQTEPLRTRWSPQPRGQLGPRTFEKIVE